MVGKLLGLVFCWGFSFRLPQALAASCPRALRAGILFFFLEYIPREIFFVMVKKKLDDKTILGGF
jgi:hypothetical protein